MHLSGIGEAHSFCSAILVLLHITYACKSLGYLARITVDKATLITLFSGMFFLFHVSRSPLSRDCMGWFQEPLPVTGYPSVTLVCNLIIACAGRRIYTWLRGLRKIISPFLGNYRDARRNTIPIVSRIGKARNRSPPSTIPTSTKGSRTTVNRSFERPHAALIPKTRIFPKIQNMHMVNNIVNIPIPPVRH